MLCGVKKGIDLSDGHALRTVRELLDPIARADLAFFDDAEIETGPVVRNQQRGNLRIVQSDADPVAGVAWLADLDDGTADPEAITDADLVIGESFHRQVLAEIPGREIRPPKIARPIPVGIELVHHDRTLLAAMALEVPLAVAIEIQLAGDNPPHDRVLPDRRPDSPAPPRDVLRKSDIDRNHDTHRGTSGDVSRARESRSEKKSLKLLYPVSATASTIIPHRKVMREPSNAETRLVESAGHGNAQCSTVTSRVHPKVKNSARSASSGFITWGLRRSRKTRSLRYRRSTQRDPGRNGVPGRHLAAWGFSSSLPEHR